MYYVWMCKLAFTILLVLCKFYWFYWMVNNQLPEVKLDSTSYRVIVWKSYDTLWHTLTHYDTLWLTQEGQVYGWASVWVAVTSCTPGTWWEHDMVQHLERTHLQRETKTLHWGNISNVRNKIRCSRTCYWYEYIFSLICYL